MQFSTGISALRANQTALGIVGHNLVNANTPGYRRQEVRFVENPTVNLNGIHVGTGVSLADVRQVTNVVLEQAMTRAITEGAGATSQLQTARRLESLFLPGAGSLVERVEQFFNAMEDLTSEPHDTALRRTVVNAAEDLAGEIQRVSAQLDLIGDGVAQEVDTAVATITSLTSQIADVNAEIVRSRGRGETPNGLISTRDQLVNQLAEFVDVRKQVGANGEEMFVLADIYMLGTEPIEIDVRRNVNGEFEIWKPGCDDPITIHGGTLGGLMGVNNERGGIKDMADQLDQLTQTLIEHVDTVHSFGLGIRGTFDSLRGQRGVADVSAPLRTAETVIPVQAGSLFVTVTDELTNEKVMTEIAINPTTDSLEDVAASLSAVDHLSAIVDTQSRTLTLVAEPNYGFDFTGGLQTRPDGVLTGTAEPTLSGRSLNAQNDEYTFTFLGSGLVGVESELLLEVRNAAGSIVNVLDVGVGYEPGTILSVSEGVQLTLGPGTVIATESFTERIVGSGDETGFLAALGLNTLFAGESAADFQVNQALVDDPAFLATTTTGFPSDTSNLVRMVNLRDERFMNGGIQTIHEFLADIAASTGRTVNELEHAGATSEQLRDSLQSEIEAVSGVDVNEEMARMLQLQRGFQVAARYISALDESLQDLFNIVR